MTYFVGGEDGSRKSITELPVKSGRPPTPHNVVLPVQSVITWHKPSERMPKPGKIYQIWYKRNDHIFWTAAISPTSYRSYAWLDTMDTDRDGDNVEIVIGDVAWWAELPPVPGGESA